MEVLRKRCAVRTFVVDAAPNVRIEGLQSHPGKLTNSPPFVGHMMKKVYTLVAVFFFFLMISQPGIPTLHQNNNNGSRSIK